MFRRSTAAFAVAGVLLVVGGATSASARQSPDATAARSCSGLVPAKINGVVICLRVGQSCAMSAKKQYLKYDFKCVNGRLK